MTQMIWSETVRDRYEVEVKRIDRNSAALAVFDRSASEDPIASKTVSLMYGAICGPDGCDVYEWQKFADSRIAVYESALEGA